MVLDGFTGIDPDQTTSAFGPVAACGGRDGLPASDPLYSPGSTLIRRPPPSSAIRSAPGVVHGIPRHPSLA